MGIRFCSILLLLGVFQTTGVAHAFYEAKDPWMKKHVQFWIKVYTEIDSDQGYIHDTKFVDRIYEVVNLKGMSSYQRSSHVRELKQKWRDILMSVHEKRNSPLRMNSDELRIFRMYADDDEPNRFLEAKQKKRVRFQMGLKNSFEQALIDSSAYLPHIEKAFIKHGVPIELTRLPFVESSFNLKAISMVGASGIWQFIKSTGKRFLMINERVDERNDPILAAEAAAKLLKHNYEALGSWPLSVTAYNHGRKSMMRAIRQIGTTDPVEIYQNYKFPSFGFASRNFLMELLAAVQIEANYQFYFKNLKRRPMLKFAEVGLADAISIKILSKYLGLSISTLKQYNPALTSMTIQGKKWIPEGYRLRLPDSFREGGLSPQETYIKKYAKIPKKYKHTTNRFSQ